MVEKTSAGAGECTAEAIAIVGMAGRFPGASSVQEFWANLAEGIESVRKFSPAEIAAASGTSEITSERHLPYGADLADPDLFDAEFFKISPREAGLTDPQHRLFLTCAWEALQDAGAPPSRTTSRIGVFGSSSLSTYLLSNLLKSPEAADPRLLYPLLIGNDKDFLTSRVSYKLGLTGPSITVQSACSSSLTAVHLACASLRAQECDAALAGGVSLSVPQTAGYDYQEGGIGSKDGHCRVFDARSSGTVKGNGCGVVVLKRLTDALTDRDHIYAVIRGSAINNDGAAKVGYTAPGTLGQQAVISSALAASGLPAEQIGYIEAHGTGTALGDPVELHALNLVHRAVGGPAEGCAVGSVKANIGHLDAAAGVVGLIKTALILHNQVIPPQINFEQPNPHLGLHRMPYQVVTSPTPRDRPLEAAAVSSFGLGGTNAHLIMSTGPTRPRRRHPGRTYPILLSARDQETITLMARHLLDHLDAHPDLELADIARTLLAGRDALPVRLAFPANTRTELRAGLAAVVHHQDVPQCAEGPASDAVSAWLDGQNVDESACGLQAANKVPLPPYPLRPKRHWIEPAQTPTSTPTVATSRSAARPEVTTAVLRTVERTLQVPHVALDGDFYDLGGDSLLAVEIVSALSDSLGLKLDIAAFAPLRTPQQMIDHISNHISGNAAPTAPAIVRDGDGRTIYLIHPAGGTNFCYYQLSSHMSTAGGPPIAAVPFPFARVDELTTLRALAREYVRQIRAQQPHGPYRIGGYSFGGNVAFEMALQLQAEGERVEQLVMFDSYPPDSYIGQPPTDSEYADAFRACIKTVLPEGPDARDRSPATDEELEALARERYDIQTGVTEFQRIWKNNHTALNRYYPDARFRGDITIFCADTPQDATLLKALHIRAKDKTHWTDHVDGNVALIPVPGDHFTIFLDPGNLHALANAWERILNGEVEPPGEPRPGAKVPAPQPRAA